MCSLMTQVTWLGLLSGVLVSVQNVAVYRSPGEENVLTMIHVLSEHRHDIIRRITEIMPFEAWVEVLEFEDRQLADNSTEKCHQCVLVTGLLKAAVQAGMTFDDARDEAIAICYNLTADVGWRGDVVCEGAIDNWGPHLVYVLNKTDLNAEEICLKINHCQPEGLQSSRPAPLRRTAGPKVNIRTCSERWPLRPYEEAVKIVHITDVHLDPEYTAGEANDCGVPVCCKEEWSGAGYAGPWADYKCNIPPQTVDLYLDFLAALNPDYLVYTGDTSPNTVWEDSPSRQINMSRILTDKIKRHLSIPAYMAIGNHDVAPTNLYYTEREEVQDIMMELALMWQTVGNLTDAQIDTLMRGGYYSVLIRPGLRILAYNSLLQTTDNYYILLDQENNGYAAMRQFMEDTFNYARSNKEKVILLAHHPTGGSGRVREYSDFITDICRRNADIIVLHLTGHSHTDTFQMNTDPETGEVYDVQISGASMTGYEDINPEAKVFYLHPDTYQVLDVDTFYLDLKNPQNNGSNPVIQLAYRATTEYNMTDFTPSSVKDLVDRMEKDEQLLNKYLANEETGTGFWKPCDADCQKEFFCNIRSTSYTQSQQCMKEIH